MTQELSLFQIDAFTDRTFGGNPAAVCPLEAWLSDETMQAIAAENNLSETAFIVPEADAPDGSSYSIRWFTPTVEVDLCGHATLASGHVVFNHLAPTLSKVSFQSRSGPLAVLRDGDSLALDFPSRPPQPLEGRANLEKVIGQKVLELLQAPNKGKVMAVLENESAVRRAEPDLAGIRALDADGLIITAKGDSVDFVSRYFVPQKGIDEDPVTGSAHSVLTPYWAAALGKTSMQALQVSIRLGTLQVKLEGDRVKISGKAVEYLRGKITL
ncbi:MAG: PhzF family phenazine biosynthesis protein [Kiloniellales bacterium]|nr:PhzF family phenazine biosynthesis protein [Kiloniellales bacterium]